MRRVVEEVVVSETDVDMDGGGERGMTELERDGQG